MVRQADIAGVREGRAAFLPRLARDTSGNTLAMMAAALLPLLGIIGGGVDMSRAYLAQSRLQQACDAGVLAARKRLGSDVSEAIPAEVAEIGQRFFNLNFRDGNYGTENRDFQLYLEEDFSISGEASVTVPTAVMNVFGYDEINIDVACEAVLSFQNLDLMMALDVTGSMRHTNLGDSMSRIDSMKQVIRDFHAEIEGNKAPGIRIRYGFVPYATNVNVGALLQNNWVVGNWSYQSRELAGTLQTEYTRGYAANWLYDSGSANWDVVVNSYPATYRAGTAPTEPGVVDQGGSGGSSGYYTCDGGQPGNTYTQDNILISTDTEPFVGPPAGTRTIEHRKLIENGRNYFTQLSGTTCTVKYHEYFNWTNTFDWITEPAYDGDSQWLYKPISISTTNWRTQTEGCIEERDTYEIDDYDNIDLTRALDLDIDLVPTADDATKWRPRYPDMIYVRSIRNNGSGSITTEEVTTTDDFADTGDWWFSDCPAPARKLAEMDAAAVDSYLATLQPFGATYHDIGMIWGGRLLSPTGLFATENRDLNQSKPTNRNLIFLTDGQTEPYDIAYGAYGVDALDQRRWSQGSPLTLTETVEQRFLAACKEVKKKNITVWVIAFGTELNPTMTECAGPGRYFEASDATQLSAAFKTIAASLGDLRISQ